ncbi:MAG: hypothetical protein HQM16_19355 [Deltaproteobacteria bacterium]|nr:hypothetical protein [Deltaproteobacteria bacterium]
MKTTAEIKFQRFITLLAVGLMIVPFIQMRTITCLEGIEQMEWDFFMIPVVTLTTPQAMVNTEAAVGVMGVHGMTGLGLV